MTLQEFLNQLLSKVRLHGWLHVHGSIDLFSQPKIEIPILQGMDKVYKLSQMGNNEVKLRCIILQ